MNGFISWYEWVKENLDSTCVEEYKLLENERRNEKTVFYNKFFNQFFKLNIKRFHVSDGKNNDEYSFVLV